MRIRKRPAERAPFDRHSVAAAGHAHWHVQRTRLCCCGCSSGQLFSSIQCTSIHSSRSSICFIHLLFLASRLRCRRHQFQLLLLIERMRTKQTNERTDKPIECLNECDDKHTKHNNSTTTTTTAQDTRWNQSRCTRRTRLPRPQPPQQQQQTATTITSRDP